MRQFGKPPLSAADITGAGGALESTRAAADTALAAPSYVTLANTSTLANERVLTGTSNQITVTDNGANGTVVLSTPQNIHTGASPTFAGETLTQALTMTGTQTALGASATGFYRDSSGNIWLCTPTLATGLALTGNGTQGMSITGAYGVGYTTSQSLFGGSTCGSYRDSSGNLNSNVATGATHIARVNGSRVGGFPLTPSDSPHQIAIYRRTGSSQSASATKVPVEFNTESVDELGVSISSGVITFANTGRYRLLFNAYVSNGGYMGISKANSSTTYAGLDFIRGSGVDFFGQTSWEGELTAGDVVRCIVEMPSGGNILAGNGSSVGDGDATWVVIERLK